MKFSLKKTSEEKLTIENLREILEEGVEFINENGSNVKFDKSGFKLFSNFIYISLSKKWGRTFILK